jgi:hypothetical protein
MIYSMFERLVESAEEVWVVKPTWKHWQEAKYNLDRSDSREAHLEMVERILRLGWLLYLQVMAGWMRSEI